MAEYIRVANSNDIPPGTMKAVSAGYARIVICHTAAGFFAVADECSHDYAPISTGRLNGREIVCPRHGARFDVETGEVKAPPAVADLETYPTRVEDGEIYVLVE